MPLGGLSKLGLEGFSAWQAMQWVAAMVRTCSSRDGPRRDGVGLARRGHEERHEKRDRRDGQGPGIGLEAVARIGPVDQVTDHGADDEDQRHRQPDMRMAGQEGIVVRDHHQQDGQRQIVVVERALLADAAIFGIRRLPGAEAAPSSCAGSG